MTREVRQPAQLITDLKELCMCDAASLPQCLYCEASATIEAQKRTLELAQKDLAAAAARAQLYSGIAWELLGVGDDYHEAIDRLFTLLIIKTSGGSEVFRPTTSGQPWKAAQAGNAVRKRARRQLERPDPEAIARVPELADKKALVLYFETEEDRDEVVTAMQLAKPTMRAVRV